MRGNRLIVGLDYGTTYTGVSFCETSDTSGGEDRIQIVQDWPSVHTMIGTKEKVPSEIAYLADGIRWGSLIPPHVGRHLWTKLELDSLKSDETEKIRCELADTNIHGKAGTRHPVDVIADFLAEVRKHLIKNLDRQYGPELWRTLPMTLIVTVPAVWSDAAKDRTMLAVTKAGFDKSTFTQLKRTVTATEPEAAAIYTIKSLKGSVQNDQLEIEDRFVICDMGGGTVDLIAYRVTSNEPTSVEEATIGSGDQCGGSFVDRAFFTWLEKKLGVQDFVKIAGCGAEQLSRTSLPPKLGRMIQEFTLTAKSGFSGTEEYYIRLPAPLSAIDDEWRDMCDGEILLKASDMVGMFEFSLQRTRELLLSQLQQAGKGDPSKVKYVFMVGGFAESPYMYAQIKLMADAYGKIQVIRPPYAWSAIVRGATAKGLEGDGRAHVKSRMCRRHYGTGCSVTFQRGVHREADAYTCEYTGTKRADGQMNWLITKGQELSTSVDSHGTLSMHQNFWPGQSRWGNLELLSADVDKAPQRKANQNVSTVATLAIDLSRVPESEFVVRHSPSRGIYHQLYYNIEISVQSVLEYSFSVNGVKYGSLTANYT